EDKLLSRNFLVNLMMPTKSELKNLFKIICIAAILCSLIFIPFVIFDRGMFLLYGDYNVQQIPFYQLAHNAIRNCQFGWNWYTDLGANFIGSYSFYLLGSPFFWMTIPFPNDWLSYLMAPLFILKFATAAMTSYAFIRRFTKTAQMAFMGALLYAFSGFMIYNIFYNHFHEVVAFFPLMLIGLEELIINNRRGLFALSVALNLVVNFYFFVPEVVFLILYFAFRCYSKCFKINIKNFLFLLTESILGTMIGIILFIPSALMLLENPRIGKMLFGYNMLFYENVQKYGLLIQSLFFPPDMPAFANFFPDSDAKWYSVAAYMPMFGMIGVISFIRDKRKNWLKYLLIALFVMMLVPVLNSAFNGFNASFYTRWFFMLTLMMSLATCVAFENKNIDLSFGIKFNFIVIICFTLIGILPRKIDNDIVFGAMPQYPQMFWINTCIALLGVGIIFFLYSNIKKGPKQFYKSSILIFCIFIVIYSSAQIIWGKSCAGSNYYENIVEKGLNAEFNLDDNEFYRVDVYDKNSTDNWPMFWKKPTIQAFQSTVPSSIMTFYKSMDISRDVASRIPSSGYDALREFLSVKYIFVKNSDNNADSSPSLPVGFEFFDHQNDFDIYENKHFVPMGFAMDRYVETETWNKVVSNKKDRVLLKGVILNDELKQKYEDILTPLSYYEITRLTNDQMLLDTDNLRSKCCDDFSITSDGFTANINLDKDNLVLFTVPYESGWKAA
ncbi:MAG: YfhO family protein, partial [Oscillospiraceae bacterium]|nr:YfhO family protein [Oscillospiraceae bacterium]